MAMMLGVREKRRGYGGGGVLFVRSGGRGAREFSVGLASRTSERDVEYLEYLQKNVGTNYVP